MIRQFKFKVRWILLLSIVSGCTSSASESTFTNKTGINGEAFYGINASSQVTQVIKSAYHNSKFLISIEADTLNVGRPLKVFVQSEIDSATVFIVRPHLYESPPITKGKQMTYEFSTHVPGQYTVLGKIVVDSISYPFEYEYLVIDPTKNRDHTHSTVAN